MRYLISIIISLLIIGCANIVPPTGGPVDQTAPKILYNKSIPDSTHLTNYNSNTIVIAFSEIIKVDGLNSELSTNPVLSEPLEYNIRKINKNQTNLIIKLKEKLRDNTTYTFDFGNSIKDVTEGNVVKQPKFVFSTGDFIDEQELKGIVKDIEGKNLEDILVGLYDVNDTVTPENCKPIYKTKTNKNGKFHFTNLAIGQYQLYAISDKNRNELYDVKSELIGFTDDQINSGNNNDTLNITLFQQEEKEFKIISMKYNKNNTSYNFNKPIKEVNITSEQVLKYQLLNNNKTLAIFPYDDQLKEDLAKFEVYDESNSKIDTNINIKFTLNESYLKSKRDIINSIQTSDNQYFKDTFSFKISVKEPIQDVLFSNIYIKQGNDTVLLKNKALINYTKNLENTELNFKVEGSFTDTVKIIIKDRFLTSIQNGTNKCKELIFLPYEERKNSSLKGTIITEKKSYIYNLYRGDKLIDRKYNLRKLNYPIMKPSEYKIVIELDENGNRKLEKGDYYKKEQPEKKFIYPNPIKLKANWEINNLKVEF